MLQSSSMRALTVKKYDPVEPNDHYRASSTIQFKKTKKALRDITTSLNFYYIIYI